MRKLFIFVLLMLLVMPLHAAPKQIIVLSQSSNGTDVTYSVLFWYPITSNLVTRTAGSLWVASGTSLGATLAENTAIQNGSVVEETGGWSGPVGTPLSAIEAQLQQKWLKRNAQIAGQGANQFYGSFFDGTVWGVQ